eukprot:m.733544 g.733544  ORF g.733544 m.733544 type:complete len:213 (-) comp58877_c0_seq4:1345-1983(-)
MSGVLVCLLSCSFSGGGSEISYTKSSSTVYQSTAGTTLESEASLDMTFELDITVVHIEGALSLGYVSERTSGVGTGSATEKATTASFTLSDPDIGKAFAVQVMIDPSFGTFLFNTMSGQSKCVVEPRTAAREGVELAWFAPADGIRSFVVPDEPAMHGQLLLGADPWHCAAGRSRRGARLDQASEHGACGREDGGAAGQHHRHGRQHELDQL